MQYSWVQCTAVQCIAVHCSTVECSVVQYSPFLLPCSGWTEHWVGQVKQLQPCFIHGNSIIAWTKYSTTVIRQGNHWFDGPSRSQFMHQAYMVDCVCFDRKETKYIFQNKYIYFKCTIYILYYFEGSTKGSHIGGVRSGLKSRWKQYSTKHFFLKRQLERTSHDFFELSSCSYSNTCHNLSFITI